MPNFSPNNALLRFNAGFLSSRVGEWLFTVAVNWVVLVQTESAMLLAVINACRLLPNLFFSVPAGEMADRLNRRRLNIVNTLLNGLLTVAVGVAFWLQLPFWLGAALVTARAVVTAAEGPFRNAYMCGLFEGRQLKSAVAQNASVMNLGRIIGPILGGVLLSSTGTLSTFLLAGLFTLAYAAALRTLPEDETKASREAGVATPRPGFRQTLRSCPELKKLLLLAVPVMLFGFPFTAMLPLVTETLLGLGAKEFGSLLAISAAGALLASTQLSLRPDHSSWPATRNSALLFGFSLLGLVFVESFRSAAVLLFVIGYISQVYRSCSRMLFQDVVPKECAGKMMGVALMDRGLIPVGGLLIGAAAEYLDPRFGVALMGIGCVLSVLLFMPRARLARLTGATVLAGSALFLTGCQKGDESASAPPVPNGAFTTVVHAWGSTEVPLKPERIVVLDLPFLDALTSLGQPVVGFAGTSDGGVPSYLKDRLPSAQPPLFVGERKQPNLEVILSLQPDLIVANPDRHKMIRPQLETIAPTIALTDDSLDEVKSSLAHMALITDRSAELEEQERLLQEAIIEAREAQDGQPTLLVVGAFEDEFSTWTVGSFVGSLFTEVGADYAYKGAPSASESQTEVAKITVENLAQLDPDLLFVYGNPEPWRSNPIYGKLKAFQQERVLEVDRDLWSRARGPIAAQLILQQYVDFLESTREVATLRD